MNPLKQVSVTTNKALVLSSNGSRSSPTNGLPADDRATNQPRSIMSAVTIDKILLSDLEQQLNSETDLSNFLDLIEIGRSLPFTKSAGTLEDEDDELADEKFQIKIRVREEANLKIASIQLLSSEEMFELHCGETNEYISSVYCDFIDKVDQQFVIHYGCQNLVKSPAKSSSAFRIESSLKKSLNIVFPKFNSSLKDTIWIFAIKLNLVECRPANFNSNIFSSMHSVIPFMQMLAKGGNHPIKPPSADLASLLDQLNSKPSSHSLPQSIGQLLPTDSPRDFFSSFFPGNQSVLDVLNNQANRSSKNPSTDSVARTPHFGVSPSKPKVLHQNRRRFGKTRGQRINCDLILKKLNSLEQKMNSIDQKLSDLRLEVSTSRAS